MWSMKCVAILTQHENIQKLGTKIYETVSGEIPELMSKVFAFQECR